MKIGSTCALGMVLAGMLTPWPALAGAPSANARAEALNDEGKALYSEQKDYAAAAAKFHEALSIAPDARYYFNLCSAEDKLEHYELALEACDEVYNHDPKPELAEKTGKRAAEIHQRMRAAAAPKLKDPTPPVTPPPVTPGPPDPSLTPASPYEE